MRKHQLPALFLWLSALLVALIMSNSPSRPANAQYSVPCHGAQGGAMMVAENGCEYEFQAGSVIDTQANARALRGAATLALTDTSVISNVYGLQRLSMTVAATATITTTGYVTGDILSLYNPTANTLTIVDSAPVYASGDIALGQYDTADLWFDGASWIQTGESNN